MATLVEITTLINDAPFRDKCKAAGLIAATGIVTELGSVTNHANRLKWAKKMFTDPDAQGFPLARAVIAANNTATLAQISGASDSQIQTAVNAVVDTLADGS